MMEVDLVDLIALVAFHNTLLSSTLDLDYDLTWRYVV